jgi:hypothetical protein
MDNSFFHIGPAVAWAIDLNIDALCSMASIDLRKEPIVLPIPAMGECYLLM